MASAAITLPTPCTRNTVAIINEARTTTTDAKLVLATLPFPLLVRTHVEPVFESAQRYIRVAESDQDYDLSIELWGNIQFGMLTEFGTGSGHSPPFPLEVFSEALLCRNPLKSNILER
jgi:hypothetical protein